jgi:ABC-2 type transport system ATP-binding protein
MIELVCDIRDRGTSRVLLSSHLLGDVETVCDEVLILKNGRIADSCDLEAERLANKSFVEIDLEIPSDDFDRRVAELGCEVASLEPGKLKLIMPPGVTVRDLWAAADSLGVGIRRLDLKRDSLQDIFLRAMEDNRGGV